MSSKKEHTLWVEKYRSQNLDSYVGNEQIKNTISKYLEQNDIQNFIFYGTAGTGKTTLAKLIVNNLNCDYLYINASDERGIDTIRDKVIGKIEILPTTSGNILKALIENNISITDVLSDEQLATQRLAQASKMQNEARVLLAEADRLQKEAATLTGATTTNGITKPKKAKVQKT